MSRGSEKLFNLLRQFFPGQEIIREYTFSNGLRLDFFLPELNLAFEWDGPQHQKYIGHFHSSKSEFYLAQNRDEQKEYICEGLGINLVRISIEDDLTLGNMADFFPGAGTGKIQPGFERYIKKVLAKQSEKTARKMGWKQYKQSDAHKARLEQARQRRKERYRQLKKSR